MKHLLATLTLIAVGGGLGAQELPASSDVESPEPMRMGTASFS